MGYELMVGHEIGEQREDLQSSLVRLSVGRDTGERAGPEAKGDGEAEDASSCVQ